jgi:hypothetical protein
MRRYQFEGQYEITVPIEVSAYSEEDARERILRKDISVSTYDPVFSDYEVVFVRSRDE